MADHPRYFMRKRSAMSIAACCWDEGCLCQYKLIRFRGRCGDSGATIWMVSVSNNVVLCNKVSANWIQYHVRVCVEK